MGNYIYNLRLSEASDYTRFGSQLVGPTYVLEVDGRPMVGAITSLDVDYLGIIMIVSLDPNKGHGRVMLEKLGELALSLGRHYLCAIDLDDNTEPKWIRFGFNLRKLQNDVVIRCKRV